jgi:type I restriction enzyme S subunit
MEKVKLTDICDFQGGSQPPKEEWSFDEQEGYIRMLQIRDFTQGERVTPEYIKISNTTKMCEANDILIARYGASIGKILTGLAGAYNVAIMRTIPDTSRIKKLYLYYYLKSPYFQNAILNVGSRAAQAGFNKEDLSKLDIECPELIKQDKIIAVLEKLECIIEKRKIELSNLDDLIKARFVEMFGDPATNPYNWDKINISEVVGDKVSNGFFAKRDDYADDGNVSVMGVAYIVNRMYSQWQDLPRTNGTDKDIEKFEVKYGDMLFCRSSLVAEGIGKASIVPEDVPQNTLFECHVIRLPLDLSKCVPEYMQVFSTMEYFRRQIIAQSKTATMTTIGQDGILKADILLPPMSKQREFYAFVHQVNKSKFDTMTFAPIYAIINLYLHTYFYQGGR